MTDGPSVCDPEDSESEAPDSTPGVGLAFDGRSTWSVGFPVACALSWGYELGRSVIVTAAGVLVGGVWTAFSSPGSGCSSAKAASAASPQRVMLQSISVPLYLFSWLS